MRRFIQGLGAGILIATLILTVAYYTVGKSKISDSEVIDRAKKLGMIQNTEAPLFTDQSDMEKEGNDTQNDSPDGVEPQQQDGSEQPAGGAEQEGESAPPEGDGSSQQDSGVTQPVENNPPVENNQPSESAPDDNAQSQNSHTLEIKPGEEATIVARHLKDIGVINDAADFDRYLRNNSYSTRLQIGTYELRGDMSYEEIASTISK